MPRSLNDLLATLIEAAFSAVCWVARIPANYEQARRWQNDTYRARSRTLDRLEEDRAKALDGRQIT